MARLRRIPQPPIDRLGRPSERRALWKGMVLAMVAAACIAVGAVRTTAVYVRNGPNVERQTLAEIPLYQALMHLEVSRSPLASAPSTSQPGSPAPQAGDPDCPT